MTGFARLARGLTAQFSQMCESGQAQSVVGQPHLTQRWILANQLGAIIATTPFLNRGLQVGSR